MEGEAQQLEEEAGEVHSYTFFLWAQCS